MHENFAGIGAGDRIQIIVRYLVFAFERKITESSQTIHFNQAVRLRPKQPRDNQVNGSSAVIQTSILVLVEQHGHFICNRPSYRHIQQLHLEYLDVLLGLNSMTSLPAGVN